MLGASNKVPQKLLIFSGNFWSRPNLTVTFGSEAHEDMEVVVDSGVNRQRLKFCIQWYKKIGSMGAREADGNSLNLRNYDF